MSIHLRLYNALVNQVPGIRERYQAKRKEYTGNKKIVSWLYLLWLNGQYHVLRNKAVGESMLLCPDLEKKIVNGSESLLDNRLAPSDLAEELSEYDIVSFDVFDTLILRRLSRPEDVFFLIQRELEYPNFKTLRKNAEWQSREKRNKQFGDYEVTLSEIWTELSSVTGIDKQTGIEAELRAEKAICYANPYFQEVIAYLLQKGKKIVVCSDMYLSKAQIKDLLSTCGYPEFSEYYISSDYHKSKYEATLYKEIKSQLGEELSYIHVGDNEFSDVKQAQKTGFHAKYYQGVQNIGEKYRSKDMDSIMSSIYSGIVNGYLHNGTVRESAEFEFGFIYGGLFVIGYCQFIHEYVKLHDVDRILFLARDGDILLKVYKYLYPNEIDICEYAYWSRLASTKMVSRILKSHYIERMVTHKIGQNYTIKDVFATMEVQDMLPLFINENRNCSESTVLDEKIAPAVYTFLDNHWEEVCKHYDQELLEGKIYFQKLIGASKKIVAVDVGWVGSGALTLNLIAKKLWDMDCDITGIMAGTCSGNGPDFETTAIEMAERKLVSYMFSSGENRDLWKIHDAVKGHNMLVELLLSSAKKSFRGFRKDQHGNYSFSTVSEKINAAEIQRGILKFAELYKAHPLGYLTISGRNAAAPIALLYDNPRYVSSILNASEIRANIE